MLVSRDCVCFAQDALRVPDYWWAEGRASQAEYPGVGYIPLRGTNPAH